MSEDRLLTVPEVAERMRVNSDSVRRWIRQARLKAIQPGGTKTGYRIRESDLQRFIKAAEKEGSQTAV